MSGVVSNGKTDGRHTTAILIMVVIGTMWFVWLNLPPSVIIFNDDFGYLRSIVATLQHGRPWTDEWLEPWAASLSMFSAILYKTTGSFRFATYGLQAAFAGGIIGITAILMRRKKLSTGHALSWSFVFLTAPPLLWKIAEFGAIPLYVFCLLTAIWAVGSKRWSIFTLAWAVAFMSRQSALLWLLLPMGLWWEKAEEGRREWSKPVTPIILLLLFAVALYVGMERGMNETNAQRVMQGNYFSNLHWQSGLRNAGIAAGVAVVSIGLAGFVFRFGDRPTSRATRISVWVKALISASIATLWLIDPRKYVEFEHGLFLETKGASYLCLLYILSLVGWWFGEFRIRISYSVVSLAMAGLLAMRHAIWDYYLIDVALFSFFGVVSSSDAELSARKHKESRILINSIMGLVSLAALFWFHGTFVARTKTLLDENYGVLLLNEKALRAGSITVTDLSTASFGLRGWNLYPYFLKNEGEGRYIADFQKYIHDGAARFHIDGPLEPPPTVENRKLKSEETLLDTQILPWGWLQLRRYNLIRTGVGEPAELGFNAENYVRPSFPLADTEWREFLDGATR